MVGPQTRETVVVIDGSQERSTALRDGLARRWLVLEPELTTSGSDAAEQIADITRNLAPPSYGLVGVSTGASVAARHALLAPDRVAVLALVSPLFVRPAEEASANADTDLQSMLGEIRCPTLAVFGQEDPLIAGDAARVYRERIPNCNIAFIYDAGHDIAAQRPDALVDLLADYLARRETFIVQTRSGVISP